MAKKKTELSEKKEVPAAMKKAAAPAASASKPAASKPAAPKPAASTGSSSPLIDTSLAANAAAAMVAGKVGSGGGKAPAANKESSAFKQLKAGLNKPAGGALGGAFGVVGQQQKKSGQNFGIGKQVGHNQTFGADVTRSGVPRRTPG